MVWFNGQYLRLPEDEKGLPAHMRGSLSSRMSAIFQSSQLIQQLLAA